MRKHTFIRTVALCESDHLLRVNGKNLNLSKHIISTHPEEIFIIFPLSADILKSLHKHRKTLKLNKR